jgi:SAM-dependent methyltransferase
VREPPPSPDERLLPSGPAGELAEAERLGRYSFAARFAAGRSVLDAGCGAGDGTALLAGAGATRVLGLDVSRHAVEEARRRAPASPALSFEHGDLLAGDLPAGGFELIVCLDVLDELADGDRAADELARALAEDGLVIASVRSGEAGAQLAARFPHSLELAQGSGLATVIAENGEGGEIGGGVLAAPSPPRRATRIVIASRRPIEPPAPLTVHAGGAEVGSWLASIADWEHRARRAEAELAAANIEIGYLTELLEDLSSRRKRGVIRSRFRRG